MRHLARLLGAGRADVVDLVAVVLCLRELGPDALPVLRPKVDACHTSLAKALDIGAMLDRSASRLPVANGLRRDTEVLRELISSASKLRCTI